MESKDNSGLLCYRMGRRKKVLSNLAFHFHPGESMRQLFFRHIQELRRLYGKFREGTLTLEEALGGYVTFFVIGPFFVIPGCVFCFIDSENQIEKDERVFYTSILFLVIFFVLMITLLSRSLPQKPSFLIQIYRVTGSAVSAILFSYICGLSYFIFWNAISGEGEPALISGPVSQMEIGSGGRFMGKPHFVTFHYHGRDIEVTVPSEEYARLEIGQTYSREMKLGGLGYYYNWGSKWWK